MSDRILLVLLFAAAVFAAVLAAPGNVNVATGGRLDGLISVIGG